MTGMTGVNDLAKLVPGFEFLQGLMKNAGGGLPGVPGVPGFGQWIAPTLDPAELDKRIQELKTVQFWLDSNAKLLGGTIQALEVQRMTLSTLQTMNLPMAELREALKVKLPEAAPRSPFAAPAQAGTSSGAASGAASANPAPRKRGKAAAPAAAAVDPMQWWGALTRQFADIAASAVKELEPGQAAAAAPAAKKPAAARKRR